jgi:hypothetical protein
MKFCGNCAAPLGNRCLKCGFDNPPAFKFCGQCGTVLRAGDAAESSADEALDGERKVVTALFADIKGSMELMEQLDPEEARRLVDPALRLMIDCVHHYDGYIV